MNYTLLDNSEACANCVDNWQETEINDDGQVAVTRKNQHAADADRLTG